MKKNIDPFKARAFFNYDSDTGILTNAFVRGRAERGTEAGTVENSGTDRCVKLYRRVMMDGVFYYTHRVIWAMQTGLQPREIDHIDGNGLNNKWCNLREGTHRRNGKNQKMHTTNTSGTTGVGELSNGRWRARIMVDGVMISLGSFSTKSDAIKARATAEAEHGFG